MRQSFKTLLFLAFFIPLAMDQLSKSHLDSFLLLQKWGPFYFESHLNPGFILQSLSQISSLARIVFVSSLYGFLFFGFFLLQSALPQTLKPLKVGITLFFSAITGNSLDRIMNGAVLDFICVSMGSRQFYFNFADVSMWIGAALVFYSFARSESVIWHPNSKRNNYLVDYRYQFKWAFQTALIAMSSTLILILFSYTFMMHVSGSADRAHGNVFLICAGLLGATFTLLTFFAGVLFSHRSAGPIYAFEKHIEALLQGEETTFRLRENDEHQNLVALSEKLNEMIQRKKDYEKAS